MWRVAARGDISQALTQHPELYTHALGHIWDLTLNAFAYLKLPLALAALAFGGCAVALAIGRNNIRRTVLAIAISMIIFFQAARIALIRFDNYLGSYPLAERLQQSPPGQLIEADAYYAFSSVFFYTDRTALLLNGRMNNLEYGSYAPDAPQVFIDDNKFVSLWKRRITLVSSNLRHRCAASGASRRPEQLACCSRERRKLLAHKPRIALRTPGIELRMRPLQFHEILCAHLVSFVALAFALQQPQTTQSYIEEKRTASVTVAMSDFE